jgi:hypothetical protein
MITATTTTPTSTSARDDQDPFVNGQVIFSNPVMGEAFFDTMAGIRIIRSMVGDVVADTGV